MKGPLFAALQAARAEKRATAVATELSTGAQALIVDGVVSGELALDEAMLAEIRRRIVRDRGGVLEGTGLFVETFAPPLRLAIVGAVHIAQALVPMASLTGYDVTVIDPRRAFSSDARFPGVAISRDWPDEALEAFGPDMRTAVVTLTHDPKLDDPALEVALKSPAFYIAALGSRKTHAGRVERLKARGLDEAAIARIHGPAGLAIGAVSPAEVAISVMAEMTAVLREAATR
jgi:xanthine dehydrogenase accessory factor